MSTDLCTIKNSCLHALCVNVGRIVWMMCVILHMSVITQDGETALMRAAYWGNTEVVVELLKAGALLDLQNTVCPYPIIHAYSVYIILKVKLYHITESH